MTLSQATLRDDVRARHGHPLLRDEDRPPEFGDLLDGRAERDEHDGRRIPRIGEHDDRRDRDEADRQRDDPDRQHRPEQSASSPGVRGALADEQGRETGLGQHGKGQADGQPQPDDAEVVGRSGPCDDRQDKDRRDRGDDAPDQQEARVPPHGLPSDHAGSVGSSGDK